MRGRVFAASLRACVLAWVGGGVGGGVGVGVGVGGCGPAAFKGRPRSAKQLAGAQIRGNPPTLHRLKSRSRDVTGMAEVNIPGP